MEQRELDGMEYLVFPALEETGMVRHMFGTRVGGVSEGKYATVNFSYTLGDRRECVDENYRRAARILTRDGDIGRFVVGRQTHTTNVRVVTEEDRGKGVTREQDYQDVDALITNVPGPAGLYRGSGPQGNRPGPFRLEGDDWRNLALYP